MSSIVTALQGDAPWHVQVVDANGNVVSSFGGSGSSGSSIVSVSNFPATQNVSVPQPLAVSGSVSILNFPAIEAVVVSQPLGVSGTVTANVTFPTTQNVQVIGQPVGVSGTVGINNFPSIQNVSLPQPLAVSGSVSILGSVTVDTELPAAAALADTASNPTTPLVGNCMLAWNGSSWDRVREASVFKSYQASGISTITTIWTPASGKKFRLMGGCISVSAAGNILFEDNAATVVVFRTPNLLADTPYNFDLGNGVLSAAANNVLKATGSVSMNLTGVLYGTEE